MPGPGAFSPFRHVIAERVAATFVRPAIASGPSTLIASGGTVTISGSTVSHTFTASGRFLVYQAGIADAVNVTGGGSSGPSPGSLAVGAYTITVGGGGSVVIQYSTDGLLAGLYATGGTIAVNGNNIEHTFTTAGNFALAAAGLIAVSWTISATGTFDGTGSSGGPANKTATCAVTVTSGSVVVSYQPGAFQPGHPLGYSTLKGWWKLDEPSGTTATDSSPAGHNGTYSGTYTLANWTGEDGVNYVDFGGGVVTIADHNDFSANTASGLTWLALIRPESAELAATTPRMFIGKTTTGDPEAEYTGYVSQPGDAGRLRFEFYSAGPGSNLSNEYLAGGALAANTWQMVAFASASPVFNQRFDLYLDSATPRVSSQATVANLTYTNSTGVVCLGGRNDVGGGNRWNGGMANVMCFAGKRTSAEIGAIRTWFLAQGWTV